jgi:hypothetical protein
MFYKILLDVKADNWYTFKVIYASKDMVSFEECRGGIYTAHVILNVKNRYFKHFSNNGILSLEDRILPFDL